MQPSPLSRASIYVFVLIICMLIQAKIGHTQPVETHRQIEELNRRLQVLEEREPTEVIPELENELSSNSALGLTLGYGETQAFFKFFGDIGFRYQDPKPEGEAHTSFAFGSLDVFVTAKIGDRFQLLSETLLEGGDGEIGLDQERFWGSWTFSDLLYLKGGMEHTVISHWNRLFHHGKWLETTIERPFLALFEDDDGILPMHYAGLEAGGKLAASWGELIYVAVVSNGRGLDPEDRQLLADGNDEKAIEVALGFSPAQVPDLQFGGAVHIDTIPPDRDNPARMDDIEEQIWSAYVEWRSGPVEFFGEFMHMRHKDRTSDQTFHHESFYLQASYRFGAWTPYGRFDFRRMDTGDPFFAPDDRDLDRWEQIFGIRYDFSQQAALKWEVGFGQLEGRRESGDIREDDLFTTALQLAWFF